MSSFKPKKGGSHSKKGKEKTDTSEWNEWEWNNEIMQEYRSRQKPNGEWEYDYRSGTQPGQSNLTQPRTLPGNTVSEYTDRDETENNQYPQPEDDGDLDDDSAQYQTSPQIPIVYPISQFSRVIPGSTTPYASTPYLSNSAPSRVPTYSSSPARYPSSQLSFAGNSEPFSLGQRRDSISSDTSANVNNPGLQTQFGNMSLAQARPSSQANEGFSKNAPQIPEDLPTQQALHPEYQIHYANEFTFGKVFKILWTEPGGQTKPRSEDGGFTEVVEKRQVKYGEISYTSIRRMVVLRSFKAHCVCSPIVTYGGRGATKDQATASDHAILYVIDKKRPGVPRTQKGEKLTKQAIRMDPKNPRVKLDVHSRINFAKLYTVEYNVKVVFIGKIHKDSKRDFSQYYNEHHPALPEMMCHVPDIAETEEEEEEEEKEKEDYK